MNSRKTIPLLLLTLAVYSPGGHAAPASLNPPSASSDLDATSLSTPPSPALGYDDTPTVTPFFTPAVFLPDYYTRPRPVHEEPPSEETNADQGREALAAFPEPAPFPATTGIPSPAPTTSVPPAPDPTVFKVIDFPSVALVSLSTPNASPSIAAMSTSSTPIPDTDVTSVPTVSSSMVSFSAPSLYPSLAHAGTSSYSGSYVVVQPTQHAETLSPETQMSRKAALIGTILALTSILSISACAACMRCRVPRALRRPGDRNEGSNGNPGDPEKASVEKMGSQTTGSQLMLSYELPSLRIHEATPTPTPELTSSSERTQYSSDTQEQSSQHPADSTQSGSVDFEDVTHILSDNAFAPISGSERSSAASESSDARNTNRTSNGVASVKAESYATCDSRYSTPSTRASQAASEGAGSTEYMTLEAVSRSPSPPESPVLRTPKQAGVCTVTRTRSKTLTGCPSPRVGSTISSSKSFPARISDVLDGGPEESEWDIAAAYGRFSKTSSVGAPSTIEEVPEHMETVDIGGRNCVLVTGYAF